MELSVIIPAYNVEKYIDNTLNSLNKQSEKEFEVIIINDGSTDNTIGMIERVLKKYQLRHTKLINKNNGGVSSVRNIGIEEARGKYLLFLDGDDYVSMNLVEEFIAVLNGQEYDVLCWGFNKVTEGQITISNYFDMYHPYDGLFTGIDALNRIIIDKSMKVCIGSAAYRRDFLLNNNLRFTEGCSNGEDQEFIIKAFAIARTVKFINSVLLFYVQREGSISHTYNIRRFDAISALKRSYEYLNNTNILRAAEIVHRIMYEDCIANYIYNFNSCIAYLVTNRKLSCKQALKWITNDIEKNYPGLNEMIVFRMKGYQGENKKLLIRVKAFLHFQPIYYWLVCMKFKLKVD
ncbi:MAG: glycosyltransferase [Bacillus sp. (in: firmicutes)]